MDNALKQYELICILDPTLEGTDLNNFKQVIEKLLIDNSGKLIHFMDPQKRNLTYPINKQNQGIYVTSHISLNPENVINFAKELKNNKQILRHLISVLEAAGEEKPKTTKKPRIKKTAKEEGTLSIKRESSTIQDDKTKLEEIDKKLDELVGI